MAAGQLPHGASQLLINKAHELCTTAVDLVSAVDLESPLLHVIEWICSIRRLLNCVACLLQGGSAESQIVRTACSRLLSAA